MTVRLPIFDCKPDYLPDHGIKYNCYDVKEGDSLKTIGKKLDVEFHEAISNIPASTKKEKGKIIEVIEKGYLLGEKVIRYAKVVVAN